MTLFPPPSQCTPVRGQKLINQVKFKPNPVLFARQLRTPDTATPRPTWQMGHHQRGGHEGILRPSDTMTAELWAAAQWPCWRRGLAPELLFLGVEFPLGWDWGEGRGGSGERGSGWGLLGGGREEGFFKRSRSSRNSKGSADFTSNVIWVEIIVHVSVLTL